MISKTNKIAVNVNLKCKSISIYEEFIKLMDKRKDWNQDELERIIYRCFEDMNYHTFNFMFVAYCFGNLEETKKAANIMLEHKKAGEALPVNMAWQRENLNKYIDQLFKGEK